MAHSDINKLELWLTNAEKSAYRAKAMAKLFGVSQRQMERWTQQIFKRSPHDWLQEQRFQKAIRELKKYRSVKMVAANLGFKQISHFSREFKIHYGLSPTAFLLWSDRQTTTK